MSSFKNKIHQQQNIYNKNWSFRITGYLLLFLFFLLHFSTRAAPGDTLYENDFSSSSDITNDWTRSGGNNSNDFTSSTSTYNSSPRSLRIRDESGGSSNSGLIDASSASGVDVSFWLRQGHPGSAPGSGDDLEFYYMNSSSSWVLLATYSGSDADGTVYTESFSLPADALHNDLRFRFDNIAGGNGDRWYVDDFEVTETGVVVPTMDHYEIIHDAAGTTCVDESVTIRACANSDCSSLATDEVSLDFQADGSTKSSPLFTGSTTFTFGHTTAETVTLDVVNPSITPSNSLVCDDGSGSSCDLVFSSSGCGTSCSTIFPGATTSGGPAPTLPTNNSTTDLTTSTDFSDGDFYYDDSTLGNNDEINFTGTNTARIYFNQSISLHQVDINTAGTADQIIIIVDGDLVLGNGTKNAIFYVTGNVDMGGNGTVNGAIAAAGTIDIRGSASVNYSSSYIDNADFGSLCGGITPITIAAWWQLEDNFLDSTLLTPHNLNPVNSPTFGFSNPDPANTIGSESTCNYATFDGSNYATVDDSGDFNFPDLTVSAWVYPTAYRPDEAGVYSLVSKDEHFEFHITGLGKLLWWWRNTNGDAHSITSTTTIALDTWAHVAVVYDSTGTQSMYINGVLEASTSFTDGLADSPCDFYIGTDVLTYSDPICALAAERNFHGHLDEVRIYNRALSASEVQADVNVVHSCGTIDHIEITNDGAGLTCLEESIIVKACADAGCTSVATTDVDVNLSATGDTTTWSSNPVTIPANSSSGVAVTLTHRTAETITLSATSSPAATNNLVCTPSGCDLVFSEAGFILGLANHNSCATPDLTIQAVKLSETGTTCAPAYTGNQSVNFVYNYSNPASGSTIPILASSNMATAGVTQNRTINFDGTASANLSFEYRDAGQLSITVSEGADDGLSPATVIPIVTPPKLLVSTSDTNNSCSGPDYGNCSVFRVAGVPGNAASEFELDVTGACADDTVTPNFQLSSIPLSSNLVAPSGGSNGSLGVTSVDITANGSVTVNQTLSEVGAFTITATPPDYQGQPIPAATSSTIGRFTPDRFAVSVDSPVDTPYFADASCDFTYQGQEFGFGASENPVITITALNSDGAITTNYGGAGVSNNDFWKLNSGLLSTRTYSNQAALFPGSLDFSLTGSSIVTSGAADYNGISKFSIEGDILTYNKSGVVPVTTNDANFDALVTLNFTAESLTDTDGVFYDSDNSGTRDNAIDDFDITDIGSTNIRWGRWFLANAYGSELQPLVMVAEAQYFDGTNFVISTTDTCTTPVTTTLTNYTGNLTAGDSILSQAAMVSGLIPLTLSAPGNNNDGSLLMTLTGPTWMMYDYDGDGSADNAKATASFGIFEGREPVIIKRQTF